LLVSRFVLIGALAVGLLASKIGHGMVDHFWGRGNGTVVWASIGLLLAADKQRFTRRRVGIQQHIELEQSHG
jgi:hypothetical protein